MAKANDKDKKSVDVFLGGACGTTTWRQNVIPILYAANKTFYNPQVPANEWHKGLMAEELFHKESSEICLFVIGRETRAVASMAEAAYYIGKTNNNNKQRVVIVLQPFPETMETLDESADLNRGRTYLRQIAEENKVPIYDSPMDAVYAIVQM
jgi:hypothetical protein